MLEQTPYSETVLPRLLVLVGHQENRRLLTNWLSQHYQVVIPRSSEDLEQGFDLAILDTYALQQLFTKIKARKEAERPLYLPTLLIASREDSAALDPKVWQTIDEVLVTPIQKSELRLRLDVLLRVRQLGVELAHSNQDLKREIVERQVAEQRLKEVLSTEATARREAEKANELKLKFLGMISHELRTPLTPIMGFASSLLASDVVFSAESQRQFISLIYEEAEKLLRLVNDLLDLTQLQAGTFKVRPQVTTIADIFDTAYPALKLITASHQFSLAIHNNLPPLSGDPERISQVFLNIIGNAVKFTPVGKSIEVRIFTVGSSIQVDIADQGVGIPETERELIFRAFQQLPFNGQISKGAGLGLAICQGIIEAHGGRIWVADSQGSGTVISFTLPCVVGTQHDDAAAPLEKTL